MSLCRKSGHQDWSSEMAIYVAIWKISETDKHAVYEYGPSEDRAGQLQVEKDTGEISIIADVPGDERGVYAPCAQRKLLKHWRDGQLPDRTCWAS